MKIAVMTWFHFDNYGTVLQAAALRRALKNFGHDAYIVDYFPGAHSLVMPTDSLRSELMSRYREMRKLGRDPVITGQISGESFEKFREEYLPMTRYCSTLTDLESLNDEYDAFICGSDRIWLPENFDPHYYLDFVNDPKRMIAYAPSILNTGKMNPHVQQQMEKLIDRFTHLSVREEHGRKFLERFFGEQTKELADPILLIETDEWETHLQLPGGDEQRYLLVCFQGFNRSYWDAAVKLAERLDLQIRIIPVHYSDLEREGAIQDAISPLDFVSLIQNADYICTDSYHGTALALNYQKEFCCFERYTDRPRLAYNERVHHILDAVGLSARLYDPDAPMERYLEKIDYIPVVYKLDALKIRSREFLKDALEQVERHISGQKEVKRHILEGYSLCTGCGACTSVCEAKAITVKMGGNGFLRAVVDENMCVRCSECLKVCPFRDENNGRMIAEGKLLSYQDEEEEFRANSSAGGLAGRLMWLLHERGTTLTGCIFDEEAQRARHIVLHPEDDLQQLEKMKGSKYLQSDLHEVWKELRETQGPVAVFGVPCQIAAARKVLSGRTDLLLIEIACGGVPSYLLFDKYKKSFRGRNKMNAETFELAVRFKQVPQNGNYIRVTDGSIEKIIPGRKDLFSRVIESGECFNEACYDCRWRTRSEADLRIGDYSASGKNGARDLSSVVCLSDAGKKLLEDMMLAGYWEGLRKKDIVAWMAQNQMENPPKPVFFEELQEKFTDDKVSLHRIFNEYVKVFEKRRKWERSLNTHD